MTQLRVSVNANDHILGDERAAVTLVEYGDYQCPFCAAAQPVVKLLLQYFGHDLRVAFRHFPLTEVHPMAAPAAETAEFAGAHGQFWAMHDSIYRYQPTLSIPVLLALADALKLSRFALQDALASHTHAPKIRTDFMSGVRSGVNGTPTFFVNGARHDGPHTVDALALAIMNAGAQASDAPVPSSVPYPLASRTASKRQ